MNADRSLWLLLFLMLIAVLAPTACILYFMNQAIDNQRDVAHQKLSEAYRGQLHLIQLQLDSYWDSRSRALDHELAGPPAVVFDRLIRAHLADAVVIFAADGTPAYPTITPRHAADYTAGRRDWAAARDAENDGRLAGAASLWARIAEKENDTNLAARALQAEIRCAAGLHAPNLFDLIGKFQTRFPAAYNLQGRLMAADELLLAIHSLPSKDPRRLSATERLHAMAADYEHNAMPSGQRLFVMDELRSLISPATAGNFPTYGAEMLAAQYLEHGGAGPGEGALRLTGVPEVWRLTTGSRRIVALFREDTLMEPVAAVLSQAVQSLGHPGGDVTFNAGTGSSGRHNLAMSGGARLPDWQISVDLKESAQSTQIALRQRASFVWLGFLVIATLTVSALLAGRVFVRQLKLARLRTDLVATVSHELKTPLAGMRLLVDRLLQTPAIPAVQNREYLELIAAENARLSRLIDNFLTFSRMERNRAQFDFTCVQPGTIIDAAVESVGDRFHVEVSRAADLPPIHADESALVTVLLNLLENAFKYSAEPRRIELGAYAEPGLCCFSVQDNGVGIDPRQRKKIFRRFYQVDRRLTRSAGGVGLGLSIVEFIVKAHGGTVTVTDGPSRGTRFTVSLPSLAAAKGLPA